MRRTKIVLTGVVLLLLSACNSLRPAEPVDSNSSVIGIAVKTRYPIILFSHNANHVYFVRLEDGSNPYTATKLLPSNYVKGRYIYLLNAEPGQYVAVASLKTDPMAAIAYSSYFSEDLIKLTEITIPAASIKFMGEYVVDLSMDMKDADSAQLHYYRLLDQMRDAVALRELVVDYTYQGSLHDSKRDSESEARFLTAVQKHLGDTGWSEIISRRVTEVNAQ